MNKIWIAIVLAAAAAGCKQGLGERCEVNADCTSGICSMASPKICVSADNPTGQIDATLPMPLPIDAPATDATDAPIDAPIDAPP